MKLQLIKGTTSKTVNLVVKDSSSTTGAGLTGLAFNTAGLTAYYVRERANPVAITLAATTPLSGYSPGGFVELDATNMPGWYRLDIPDAALATGSGSVGIMLKGATNMAPSELEIELTGIDLQASAVPTQGTISGEVLIMAPTRDSMNVQNMSEALVEDGIIGRAILFTSGAAIQSMARVTNYNVTGAQLFFDPPVPQTSAPNDTFIILPAFQGVDVNAWAGNGGASIKIGSSNLPEIEVGAYATSQSPTDAIVAAHLDHLLQVATTSFPGNAGSILGEMLERITTWRYVTEALSQAPSGGGGGLTKQDVADALSLAPVDVPQSGSVNQALPLGNAPTSGPLITGGLGANQLNTNQGAVDGNVVAWQDDSLVNGTKMIQNAGTTPEWTQAALSEAATAIGTRQVPDAVASPGQRPTFDQALYLLAQNATDFEITDNGNGSSTLTIKKPDNTVLATLALNGDINTPPTLKTRAT